MRKAELRQAMRESKRRHTGDELGRRSLAAVTRLMAHQHYLAARTVMLYCSLPDEVDTTPLLADGQKKTIVLPRVTGPETMELRLYQGPASMAKGAFGIMEPTGQAFTDYQAIDLAIVPGMAFDPQGHRLGRGRGYYDRFLPLIPQAYKIGLCFPFQLVGNVPTEPTDIAMDEVVC